MMMHMNLKGTTQNQTHFFCVLFIVAASLFRTEIVQINTELKLVLESPRLGV